MCTCEEEAVVCCAGLGYDRSVTGFVGVFFHLKIIVMTFTKMPREAWRLVEARLTYIQETFYVVSECCARFLCLLIFDPTSVNALKLAVFASLDPRGVVSLVVCMLQ